MSDERPPAAHTLKSQPPLFEELYEGRKTHELRLDDRDYAVEDILLLREWQPTTGGEGRYTGRVQLARITHVLRSGDHPAIVDALADGFCILSVQRVQLENEAAPE